MADEKILSYNDVVLRKSDLDILSGPCFLNDRIIEFYFSYLPSCYPSEDILLVPPSISFWITNCPDKESLKDFVEPLKFPDKKVIIFSVNDNEDLTMPEGGAHWSLLAYERTRNVFLHHDSMGGFNKMHSKRLYTAVVGFIGESDSKLPVKFVESPTPWKQMNGCDCGLYVTAIAKVIFHWHQRYESGEVTDLWISALKEVEPAVVSKMRKEILVLIQDLMAKRDSGQNVEKVQKTLT